MTETQLREPGTLVWIGSRDHPEFADAYRFCVEHAAQLAVRQNPQSFAARPAGYVKRILFAQPDRRPIANQTFQSIRLRYPAAKFLVLASALCDGQSRTGGSWPDVRTLRFSRWQEVLPSWLSECGHEVTGRRPGGSVVVLCDRYEFAEPLLDYGAAIGRTMIWQRDSNFTNMRNAGSVLWDDSVAVAASGDAWRQRLCRVPKALHSTHHKWMVTQPHATEIAAAITAGISEVISKPFSMEQLF